MGLHYFINVLKGQEKNKERTGVSDECCVQTEAELTLNMHTQMQPCLPMLYSLWLMFGKVL